MDWMDENLIKTLKAGGVAVMPTDTLYGIVGLAENPETVKRIYEIRKRNPEKPCIVLIGDISELKKFSINLSSSEEEKLKEHWPGPVSIILDCDDEKLEYLHRGTNTLAFRVPAPVSLQKLLKETGPLIAPSANPEGLLPSKNIQEAESYFGSTVDLYFENDKAVEGGKPSKVIKLNKDGSVSVLRP